MSLHETGHSTDSISLQALLGADVEVRTGDPGLSLHDIAVRLCVGGWPGLLDATTDAALRWNRDYVDEISRTDIRQVDGVARDRARVERVLRSLARNVATEAALTTIAADTGGPDGAVKDDTVSDYLSALELLMVIEDQPAWSPHLRSKSRLRKAPKRHFSDPSLAVAALRAGAPGLLHDLNLFGLLFESLVVRDLRIYAQALGATVSHYRDNTGLEVDAIVDAGDGRWAAFEVKLGGEAPIEEGAASLLKFAGRVDTDRIGVPSALAVVVATGYGYRRPDGVDVIPIGALAP